MRTILAALCVGLALAASAPSAIAQAARKPASRPPVKSAQAPPVKGTPQLPGDNGKLDQAYTMGVDQQLNFTLRGAEYTLGRLVIGQAYYAPLKDQKLLLLRFTVQNPNKSETQLRFDTFKFMAVDSQDVNHDGIPDIVKQDENQKSLDINLKPGQRVDVETGILVPAKVSVPKLIVEHNSGGKVLRCDMHGIIKPLPAPYADPADKTGATALAEIPAARDEFYPLDQLDLKYVSAALTAEKLGEHEPGEGKQFLVVTIALRNGTNAEQNYRFDTLAVRLTTADGEKEDHTQNELLKTSRNEDANSALPAGESYICRLVVEVSKDVKLSKLALSQGELARIRIRRWRRKVERNASAPKTCCRRLECSLDTLKSPSTPNLGEDTRTAPASSPRIGG